MKNLKQKLLISLILWLGLSIWWSFATIINTNGRTPNGALKLRTLILTKSGNINTTWILLDWSWYIIRVGSINQSWVTIEWTTSKLRVNQICDADWNKCTDVSDISDASAWIPTGGSDITITGSDNFICIKSGNDTLNCKAAKLWNTFIDTRYCRYSTDIWLVCDAEWQGWTPWPQWPQWATWATWPKWATWATWPKWATWATWPQWATWATWPAWSGWDSLWTIDNTKTTVYTKDSKPAAIWTTTSWGYTLNVVWSWKFSNNLNIGSYLYIHGYNNRKVYEPWKCLEKYQSSPMINYYDELVIRQQTWLSCANDYTMLGANGNMWIGGESNTWNIKLSVYWHTRLYSTGSATDRYIDLYHTNNKSYIESKRTTMRIGLTWYIEWFWAPTYIYMDYWSIWINKTPHANSPTNGSINATLQINWWIQISNNSTISTSSPGNNCSSNQAWMIQYYNWDFYGCNGSVWKKFNMTSLTNLSS